MMRIDEKRIYQLHNQLEEALFSGEIPKYSAADILDLCEALWVLKQLAKHSVIKCGGKGLLAKELLDKLADNKKAEATE
jgi:hypothetical protein